MFGFLETGFKIKRLEDIKTSIEARFRAEFGESTRVGPTSINGQLIGIMALVLSPVWELAQASYWALDPNQAKGVLLENLARIIGIEKLWATPSTVVLTVTGDAETLIESGSIVEQTGTGIRFVTVQDVTLDSEGEGVVVAQSEAKGPIEAAPGTLTQIISSTPGWATVTNVFAASLGRRDERDSELRLRMRTELQRPGSTNINALRARLMEIDDVIGAIVLENDELETDGDGLIGKAIEAVVRGGDDDEIAQMIFDHKAGGMKAASSAEEAPQKVEVVVIDDSGGLHTVAFTRPDDINIHITLTLYANRTISVDELARVKAQVFDIATTSFNIGDDIILWRFQKAGEEVDGIIDIEVIAGKTAGSQVGSNVAVAPREFPNFSMDNITIEQGV